jgi:hypothetical protein
MRRRARRSTQPLDFTHVNYDEFKRTTETQAWRHCSEQMLAIELAPEVKDALGTHWVEAGHHIREQIGDDKHLIRFLRHALPKYTGGPCTLYRGENLDRWLSGTVGTNWTSQMEKARMFARGLNSVASGGVLLRAQFAPEAIISGPNAHSKWLNEEQFTVDPSVAASLVELERFKCGLATKVVASVGAVKSNKSFERTREG